ncbi:MULTISPECIES: hypothetical protein [Sulfitobacter]|uniref:hypothetical protein n=1 Tax=Sulfitobacter sp. TMED3 TaxID=1986591 RepID=UPI000B54E394|nr:hypothetical protein [Sulfitobacter sp. TMED3]OUS19007.1 hypothetical protein A9Q95_16315 [Rhodobacterales bacterium 59_46_T64]OUT38163.1 MAG: hypothetical protein CBB63_03125 [Sulfitobacter sp. TMED3]
MRPRPFLILLVAIALPVFVSSAAQAETCLAPARPFVPNDPAAAREYADLIRQDFEDYISDVQDYFRCMEGERSRAFTEAQEVSQEYGQFIQLIQQ